jgi:predicted RNA-binding Zn-ribbon protein involved in translation (DUF1610 family)
VSFPSAASSLDSIYLNVSHKLYENVLLAILLQGEGGDEAVSNLLYEPVTPIDNPFRYGTAVTGKNFVGRETSLSEIQAQIGARQSVVIRSKRRMGKSSLLAELARRHSRDFVFVYLDLYGTTSEGQLLDLMTREIVRSSSGKRSSIDPSIWNLLRSSRLKLAVLENEHRGASMAHGKTNLTPLQKEGDNAEERDGTSKPVEIRMCPTCGKPLKWVEQYARHYCYTCKRYKPKRRKIKLRDLIQETGLDDLCPICGEETRFVAKYSEFYCDSCKAYPFIQRKNRLTEDFTPADMIEVLDLPQRVAEQNGKRVVVMFDEFQEVAPIDGGSILKTMRSRFETHRDVSYIFAGSKSSLLQSIFDNKDGAFFKFARTIELEPIDEPTMVGFLIDRFRAGSGKLSKEAAYRIASLSDGYPFYAQQLAHELFHISEIPSLEDVDKAIRLVVEQQSHAYSFIWESIRSPLHRRYLTATAMEPRVPHGAGFVRRYGLRSRSHVQRIEKQLEARGILEDGEVADPLFVLWLRSRGAGM